MIASMLGSACRAIAGPMVEWRCDPFTTAQRIYFANHSSHLDFIVIWSALPPRLRRRARPVAGRDYWDRGVIRRRLAHQVFRAVLIERRSAGTEPSREAARASIDQMARAMGDDTSLVVFPEGTRSTDGEIRAFRSGLYYLSRAKREAELIPVYLENLNRILPKGEALPLPMLSRVIFGAGVASAADDEKDAFLTRARAALLRLKGAA